MGRFAWVIGRGWVTPDVAEAAKHRPETVGHELAFVIRGYLVDPREVTTEGPTWDEMLRLVEQILRNPLFPNFNDLALSRTGESDAAIADATGRVVARVERERPGRVRTVPLDH
jgi:hypothetical protein